jgi:hypothetical protein
MAETVTVYCSIVNGAELDLFDAKFSDGTGLDQYFPSERVILKGPSGRAAGFGNPSSGPAIANEVDATFWVRWLAKNKNTTLVTSGAISGPKE